LALKAEAAIADVKIAVPSVNVVFLLLDLMSFQSIRKAAERVKSESSRLDLLINNAGILIATDSFIPHTDLGIKV